MSNKICYVANIRLPTEKAHGVQIMKTCEALARQGVVVELIVPNRRTHIGDDPFGYYAVEKIFSITRLPVIDTVKWGKIGFIVETISFAVAAFFHLRGRYTDAIFGRDETILYPLSFLSTRRLVWETHTGAWNFFAKKLVTRATHIITISQGLKDYYVKHGVSTRKLFVAHDGVDLEGFALNISQKDARQFLGLPEDKSIALYAGRLDGWKGVDTFFSSVHFFDEGIIPVVIGGEDWEVQKLSKDHPKVKFLGYKPYAELARNLRAADVLVLPNNGKDEVSVNFTSPHKLFAYMATGIPIVASDLPSIREILDEQSATLVEADNPLALARGIIKVLNKDVLTKDHGLNAKQKVLGYSWAKRAEYILAVVFEGET